MDIFTRINFIKLCKCLVSFIFFAINLNLSKLYLILENGRILDSARWQRSPKVGVISAAEELMNGIVGVSTMSPLAHEYKNGGNAGVPLSKIDNPDGKKIVSNGMARVHRLMSDEEITQGKQTRWTELEIHGKNFFKFYKYILLNYII